MSVSVSSSFPFSARALRTGDSPISWLMKLAIEDPEMLSLAAGFVDGTTLPEDLLREGISQVFRDEASGKAALQYGGTAGLKELREELARKLESQGIPNVDPECLVISNGGQQSLFTITEVLVDPGDIVLVEDPTYFVYMDVLQASGARSMGVTTDGEGIVPEALEERFAQLREQGLRDRLKILYVMSYYTNPKGTNMSRGRREAIMEIYRRELERGPSFVLIEDACYRDLCLDGDEEPYLKAWDGENETVFTSGTFSKAFAPGLRLGWSYMPPALHQAFCRQKGAQDFGSSNMNQRIMAERLRSGAYDRAAERFRDRYRLKRDAALEAIAEYWPEDTELVSPMGGLYIWARMPGIDTDPGSPFFEAALKAKVLYVPGYYCYCGETQDPKPTDTMRLCYSYIDIKPMREAIRRLGDVARSVRGG